MVPSNEVNVARCSSTWLRARGGSTLAINWNTPTSKKACAFTRCSLKATVTRGGVGADPSSGRPTEKSVLPLSSSSSSHLLVINVKKTFQFETQCKGDISQRHDLSRLYTVF